MKLRLVKNFTSRENEIERKEEGGRSTTITRPSATQPGLGQSSCPLPDLTLLLPSSFLPLPPPSSRQPATCRPSLSAATCRQAVAPAIPPPAVPLLPFFFIKLPKQQSGRPLRSVVPSLPVQLADCGPPSSPHPCPFTKSGGRDSSPVLMASSLWRVEP